MECAVYYGDDPGDTGRFGKIPGTQYQLWLFGEFWYAAWLLWAEYTPHQFLQAFEE